MKTEDFYQKYGHPSHWKCLENLDEIEEEPINYKRLSPHLSNFSQNSTGEYKSKISTHDRTINKIEHRLKHLDDIIGKNRHYLKEYEYYLNKKQCAYGLNGQHEIDLACIMEDKAYVFEVKSSEGHQNKANKQLDADYWLIKRDFPQVKQIYKFYVCGKPNNYRIEKV